MLILKGKTITHVVRKSQTRQQFHHGEKLKLSARICDWNSGPLGPHRSLILAKSELVTNHARPFVLSSLYELITRIFKINS